MWQPETLPCHVHTGLLDLTPPLPPHLLQAVTQRWPSLRPSTREWIADGIGALPPGSGSQELQEQLRLVLDAAGESWHVDPAAEGGSAAGGGAEVAPAVARWRQRAAAACEEAAAAMLKQQEVPSDMLLGPLNMLKIGHIGGAPLMVGRAWHWRQVLVFSTRAWRVLLLAFVTSAPVSLPTSENAVPAVLPPSAGGGGRVGQLYAGAAAGAV